MHVVPGLEKAMRRRDFIKVIGGTAAAWPLAARAQQRDRVRRVGILMSVAKDPATEPRIKIFQEELQKAGWVNGRNVQVDVRWGGGDFDLIRKHASDLVAIPSDVVLATGIVPVRELRRASSTTPIVFVLVIDPVGSGLVDSLARPGGNITGFPQFEFSMCSKWVELLKEMVPRIRRIGVLRHPTDGSGIAQYGVVQSAAQSLGIESSPIDPSDASTIEQGIAAFASAPDRGLIVTTSQAATIHWELIIRLAAQHRLPAVYAHRFFASGGGLISYGADLMDQYRRAASYCDRILKGEKPADLPVQQPTKFELVINLKTAKALGLTMPDKLLAIADEVIE
jgi:putative ABC transport system substrate-binding protein